MGITVIIFLLAAVEKYFLWNYNNRKRGMRDEFTVL